MQESEMLSRVEALELELATLKAALKAHQEQGRGKRRADFYGILPALPADVWQDFQEAKSHPWTEDCPS